MIDNKLDGIPRKSKWKICACFYFISSFESTSYKKIQLPVFLFLSAFTSTDIIFYIFSTSFNTIWKKIFGANFHFFNRFTPTLQPPYQRKFAKHDKSLFYLLFGCPPPTFGHYGGHSLTNPMLITAFSLFCLEGY